MDMPPIIQGTDGRNYDEHLEYLFKSFEDDDLSERDIILNNLQIYADTLCPEPTPIPEGLLDDTVIALTWVMKISSISLWELDASDIQNAGERGHPDHHYGAFLITGERSHKYSPVTAHNIKNAVLLAVVQRFREEVDPTLNPTRPRGTAVN